MQTPMAETILVIEDERLTRTNLVDFLRSEGFTALSAENGRTGIELAQAHLPDLIICDIMMPELDGYDVLSTLQHRPNTSAIPFIFLTATEESSLQHSLAMGADDYLSKPITSEQLRSAIAAQLKNQHLKGEQPRLQPSLAAPSLPGNIQGRSNALGELSVSEMQHLMLSKDFLLGEFSQTVLTKLADLRCTIEQLQGLTSDPRQNRLIRDLQGDFTRLLAFVNEISALQKALTPTNIDTLLEQFLKSNEALRSHQR